MGPPHAKTRDDIPPPEWLWEVVEAAIEGIITIDKQGIIQYANPAAHSMFDYQVPDLLGKNVSMLMPSPFTEEHDGYISRYVETGKARIIGIGREVEGKKRTGELFPVHLAITEVFTEGRRIFTGTIHDISDSKNAEIEKDRLLTEINAKNRELSCLYRVAELLRSTQLSGGLLTQVVEAMNSALTSQTSVGARITLDGKDYVSHHFQPTPWISSTEIMAGKRSRGRVEVHHLSKNVPGASPALRKGNEKIIDAIALMIGETLQRRESEAKVMQASKLASIGQLAAGVGHEINNPVNGIINCADILINESEEGTKIRRFSELVRSEAERIAGIVRDLLTFSRQDHDEYSAAYLTHIVESVLNLCRKSIENSQIRLTVDIPESVPKIDCRSEQLQQVVMNLVLNAMHALDERFPNNSPDKKLTIRATYNDDSENPTVELTIEDRGTGIAEENLDRIFDPFFTTKGRELGTGLGLSVSDGIVRNHGGTLTVESVKDDYTIFRVSLPVRAQTRLRETEQVEAYHEG